MTYRDVDLCGNVLSYSYDFFVPGPRRWHILGECFFAFFRTGKRIFGISGQIQCVHAGINAMCFSLCAVCRFVNLTVWYNCCGEKLEKENLHHRPISLSYGPCNQHTFSWIHTCTTLLSALIIARVPVKSEGGKDSRSTQWSGMRGPIDWLVVGGVRRSDDQEAWAHGPLFSAIISSWRSSFAESQKFVELGPVDGGNGDSDSGRVCSKKNSLHFGDAVPRLLPGVGVHRLMPWIHSEPAYHRFAEE